MSPIPLLIFPCNGNAIEAADCLGSSYELIGFVDDTPEKIGSRLFSWTVFSRSALEEHPEANVLAVPGSPVSYRKRDAVVGSLGVRPDRYARVIHPTASVSQHARLGVNVLIMAGVVITSNAVIGDHVCVLPNSVVHHDSKVGDWSLVGANVTVAGSVSIGRQSYIGSGSTIMNGVVIGDGALVGLGSNVLRDVPAGSVVAGNPARQLPRR